MMFSNCLLRNVCAVIQMHSGLVAGANSNHYFGASKQSTEVSSRWQQSIACRIQNNEQRAGEVVAKSVYEAAIDWGSHLNRYCNDDSQTLGLCFENGGAAY